MKQRRYRTRHLEYDKPGVYHVISRVAFAEFRLEELEREVLVRGMNRLAGFCGIELLSYSVLSNHFHLLARVPPPPEEGIDDTELLRRYRFLYSENDPPTAFHPRPSVMEGILRDGGEKADEWRERLHARMHDLPVYVKELKQRFTHWYNAVHEGFGTVWAERYRCVLVEDSPDVLRVVAAYIELNAVRAGIVEDPESYRWCSLAAAVAGISSARLGIQRVTGKESWKAAMALYRLHIYGEGTSGKEPDAPTVNPDRAKAVIAAKGAMPLPELLRRRVRYFADGAILGSRAFIEAFIREHSDQFSRRKRKAGHRCENDDALGGLHALRKLRNPFNGNVRSSDVSKNKHSERPTT